MPVLIKRALGTGKNRIERPLFPYQDRSYLNSQHKALAFIFIPRPRPPFFLGALLFASFSRVSRTKRAKDKMKELPDKQQGSQMHNSECLFGIHEPTPVTGERIKILDGRPGRPQAVNNGPNRRRQQVQHRPGLQEQKRQYGNVGRPPYREWASAQMPTSARRPAGASRIPTNFNRRFPGRPCGCLSPASPRQATRDHVIPPQGRPRAACPAVKPEQKRSQ